MLTADNPLRRALLGIPAGLSGSCRASVPRVARSRLCSWWVPPWPAHIAMTGSRRARSRDVANTSSGHRHEVLEAAVAAERDRIAREWHDIVAQRQCHDGAGGCGLDAARPRSPTGTHAERAGRGGDDRGVGRARAPRRAAGVLCTPDSNCPGAPACTAWLSSRSRTPTHNQGIESRCRLVAGNRPPARLLGTGAARGWCTSRDRGGAA